jgi:hydroxymethylglutaryl-CoA lyase
LTVLDHIGGSVRVVEVGPRDGLQSHPKILPTDLKRHLVEALVTAGLSDVEVTSFVRPDRVPQLADADVLMPQVASLPGRLMALVANDRGLERAIAAGAGAIALVTAVSDGFSRANVGRSADDSTRNLRELATRARADGLWVRAYVSTCFRCPYDGPVAPREAVARVEQVAMANVDEVVVGDTLGSADPRQIAEVCEPLVQSVGADRLALHLHDTYGLALANLLVALQVGLRSFDGSIGGLGGCPFAPGARGNVATEKIVYFCERLGLNTGVDLRKLRVARELLAGHITDEWPFPEDGT